MPGFIFGGQLFYHFGHSISKFNFGLFHFEGTVVQASMYVNSLAFVDSEDRLWVYGNNHCGLLGIPDSDTVPLTQILPDVRFEFVLCGPNATLALDVNGNIWYSGILNTINYGKQFAKLNGINQAKLFTQLTNDTRFANISFCGNSCLATDIDANLYNFQEVYEKNKFTLLRSNIKQVVGAGSKILCIDINDDLWISLDNKTAQNAETFSVNQLTQGSWVKDVIGFFYDVYILSKDGEVVFMKHEDILNNIVDPENIKRTIIEQNIVGISVSSYIYMMDINGKLLQLEKERSSTQIPGVIVESLVNQHNYPLGGRTMTIKSARKI